MLHRLRTTASCLWLCRAPQRTLEGCGYTLELFRGPRFHEVPTAPGFPLQPSYITARSSAYVCGTGCALSIRPPDGTGYPLSHPTRSHRHFLRCAVSWSPNMLVSSIGSKGGVAPPSAQRSVASPIRGTTLQRLLGTSMACWFLSGWRPDVAFQPVCICSWRSARNALRLKSRDASGRPPQLECIRAVSQAQPAFSCSV